MPTELSGAAAAYQDTLECLHHLRDLPASPTVEDVEERLLDVMDWIWSMMTSDERQAAHMSAGAPRQPR